MIGLTAQNLVASIKRREISATELTQRALKRIEASDPVLNAFTDVTTERALREAAAVDRKLAAGDDPGPLAGVPYAVKNLFDIQGLPTLAGSKINRGYPPARRDATLIQRLQAAGAVLLGGLNMGEYAYDFTGENSHYGPTRNPHDPRYMAGGSSGGCGAAVAAAQVALALGSDTNGSIRVPSSFCGLFGLKPTYGRLSRAGAFPFCTSLDHLGPFARSAYDLALAYDAMQGSDPLDPACTTPPPQPVFPQLGTGLKDLRIAVANDYFAHGGTPQAYAAVAQVASALRATHVVSLPEAARARAAAFVVTNCEGAHLHLDRLRQRAADFDPDVRDRLLAGALMPANWYLQAQRFRHWYHREVLKVFEQVDVVLAPATPCSAPEIGQKQLVIEGVTVMLRPNIGIYTQPLSFIGLPIVAAPIQEAGGLPIAVQVIAAPWREDRVLRVAAELENQGVAASPAVLRDF